MALLDLDSDEYCINESDVAITTTLTLQTSGAWASEFYSALPRSAATALGAGRRSLCALRLALSSPLDY
jgi:hypothetical protein